MDFLKKLSINEDNATPAPAPVPVESKKEHILDKVSDVLGGGHHHQQSTPAPPPAQPKEEHLLDKLSSAFGGSHSTPAPAPAPQKEEHLLDKLSNAFGHSTPPPPPAPKHEGLLGKLEEVVGHATKSDEPAKPKTLGDKINNVLGGGSKGEQNEDTLDKAIDFVQEHVLKEGQQKDETAVEQLKDKQIAEVLRHGFKSATGKDIPSLHGHKNNE